MSHPFRWVPADGLRHASLRPTTGGGYPQGLELDTLCGKAVSAETGALPWLWRTCPDCDLAARKLVGAVIRQWTADPHDQPSRPSAANSPQDGALS